MTEILVLLRINASALQVNWYVEEFLILLILHGHAMMQINALKMIFALLEEVARVPIPYPQYLATTVSFALLATTATEAEVALEEEQIPAMIVRPALLTLALRPDVSMKPKFATTAMPAPRTCVTI